MKVSAPLTFQWTAREGGSWWLVLFVFLSFVLHSAAFFIFQGKNHVPARAPRTAPSVQLLTALSPDGTRSPENEALLEWIATQDPALFAKVASVEPKGLLDIRYKPSFETPRTHPLGVPPEPDTVEYPSPRDPLALIRSVMPRTEVKRPAVAPQPTRVTFSESLASRSPADLHFAPQSKTNKPVEPTTLLAGISDKGEVRFVFLNAPGGSPELDAEAPAFLRTLRFAAVEKPLEWGTVTFFWGDDAFAAPDAPR